MNHPRKDPSQEDPARVRIFDTTLRDGEQAPGFSMSLEEKLRLAGALDQLGVDVLEAGFPAASPGDFEAVQQVARAVSGPVVTGLARCHAGDIERAWEALRDAGQPRLHVFLATSPLHREHKLNMSRATVLATLREGIQRARDLCPDVEFSAEDATRTEPGFLAEVVAAAAQAGARTINLPDTVGYGLPHEIEELFRAAAGAAGDAQLSAHCHDDLGLAVANSLAAVRAGARQVECTINGIGERAGNAALEEFAMALRARAEGLVEPRGIGRPHHGLDTRRLCATSRLLTSITGVGVPPNKAVVGANAFAHEAGIHQHGVLAHRSTYEVLRAEDVGAEAAQLILGKHSGRHALRARLVVLGVQLDDEHFNEVFESFKELADKKSEVQDADLEELALGSVRAVGPWRLHTLHVATATGSPPTASVEVSLEDGDPRREAATGDGPVDALLRALSRATGSQLTRLAHYRVDSVTDGEDALGRASLRCDVGGRTLRGQGVSTDVLEATAHAFLDVINRSLRGARHAAPDWNQCARFRA